MRRSRTTPTTVLRRGALLALLVGAALPAPAPAAGADAAPGARIVNGTPAPPGAWPSIAALVLADRPAEAGQFCGGTLVHPRWVVTAAHCVTTQGPPAAVNPPEFQHVVLGRTRLDQAAVGERIVVAGVFVHPAWIPGDFTGGSDIALLLLAAPSAQPVMPYATRAATDAGAYGWNDGTPNIAGWGSFLPAPGPGTSPLDLLHGTVQIITGPACIGLSAQPFPPATTTCTLTTGAVNSCRGDSGGPLTVTEHATGSRVLWGIVSFGPLPCATGDPAKYTWVPAFEDFLAATIAQHTPAPPPPPAPPAAPAVSAPPPPPPDTTAPEIRSLRVAPRTFRAARRGGARVLVELSEPASVELSFARRACRRREPGGRRRCAYRPVRRATTTLRADGTTLSARITGRAGSRRLRAGRYRLTATATDAAGNRSASRRAAFRIAAERRSAQPSSRSTSAAASPR